MQHVRGPVSGRDLLLCFLIGLGIAAFWALDVHVRQQRFVDLQQHGVAVDARVVATACQNHRTLYYAFSANGRVYQGSKPYAVECQAWKAGDRLAVVYARNNPRNSTADDVDAKIDAIGGEYPYIALVAIIPWLWPALLYGLRPMFEADDPDAD